MATETDYTRKCQQLDLLIDLLEKENKRLREMIVYCKDCKHYEADITGNPWGVCCHKDWIANNVGHDVDEDGWCYRAERSPT